MVKRLAMAFAVAAPREETREIAPHIAFFQRVAAMIGKSGWPTSQGRRSTWPARIPHHATSTRP